MIKLDQNQKQTGKKSDTYESANVLYEGQELILDVFRSGIFPIKPTQGKGHSLELAHVAKFSDLSCLKIQTPEQILQRLPIGLAQEKAGNTSENLLNEISQIIYSLYRAKETTKKVYNNIVDSIKL